MPHQIPFRAASFGRLAGDGVAEGVYLVSASDALTEASICLEVILVEAMAQVAGGLAFGQSGSRGFLSAIEGASWTGTASAGDRIDLRVELEAEFGRIFRFRGVATREGLEFGRAKFYLAAPE